MPIRWTLKKWLAVEHDIYRPSELKTKILESTGVQISHQALSELLRRTPKNLKLSTMEILCTTFQCQLSDFCDVTPGKVKSRRLRQPYRAHGKHRKPPASFPSPDDFQPKSPSE